ncbi:MAG: hypothetical protein IJJ84_09735 [Kiritimatiellae bacterium]|nr:hypothetical protein [Kiritimatiellia bacterium]
MKPHYKHLATALAATLQLAALAAVPLSWDARPGQPAPASFDRYHGEALEFRCTFRGFGELPFAPGADIRLWYQTNGMGAAWWSAPATIQSNVLSATWSPALDPGADRVSLFFGAPSNAYASAVLRLRHSPGFAPGTMPDPETFHESDPVFAAWLSTYTPPDTSLEPSTNYTDRALGEFAATGTVFRAATYGTPTRWTDATGCVWEVMLNVWVDHAEGNVFRGGTSIFPSEEEGDMRGYLYYDPAAMEYVGGTGGGWYYNGHSSAESPGAVFAGGPDATSLDNGRFTFGNFTNLVSRVAYTDDIPPATDLSPIEQDIADLRTESALVYRLYSGSNVVAEVTNYNSQVHAPALRLMQLNESNEYVTVWTETNGLTRTLRDATDYTDRAIADYAAPRAWSRTTSGLGAEAPANTTWISTPTTVIAGGLEYAKFVDTYGEVWVLTSNGMAAEFNPDTNAYFRITADDGTPVFSIEKSDAQLVGANAAGITVGESTITIPVPVVSSVAPTMYWRASLSSGDWADELSPPTGATVTWSATAGSWVCTVSFTGTRPSSMFFKFNFLQEGGVVIRNNATTDLSSGIYVNGTKFVPTVSGNNLIWTKQ